MRRLAILDRAEPAMRCISAVAELNHQSREPITTIALYRLEGAPWIAREADEAVLLSPDTASHHSTRLDPARLLVTLAAARADALWADRDLIAGPAKLARLCERAGIAVIGPGSDVLRRLADKAQLRQLAAGLGVPVAESTPGSLARYAEVQVVADGLGTVWAVGVRDASIRQRDQQVIVESACPAA